MYSKQLLQEPENVTSRPKLEKYFPSNEVEEMLELIKTIVVELNLESLHTICRV